MTLLAGAPPPDPGEMWHEYIGSGSVRVLWDEWPEAVGYHVFRAIGPAVDVEYEFPYDYEWLTEDALLEEPRFYDAAILTDVSAEDKFVWYAVVWSKNGGNSWEYFVHLPYPVPRYTQYRQAVIGDPYVSSYDMTPVETRPQNTVGIGEKFTCAINPATWYDDFVSDETYGPILWTITGPGVIVGNANQPTVKIQALKDPGTINVWVRFWDNDDMYQDTESADEVLPITVLAPEGITYTNAVEDHGHWGWTPATNQPPDPPNNIGAATKYDILILPLKVVFDAPTNGLDFAEIFAAPQYVTQWPNGTQYSGKAAGTEVPYNPGVHGPNKTVDHWKDGLVNTQKLNTLTWPQENYQTFTAGPITFTENYKNQAGQWVFFATSQSWVRISGSTFQGQHKANTSDWGPPTGPFN
jgi:hypothetical protein